MKATKTKITIDYVSTDTLHPLYVQYDGQVTAQPSYVEIDLESGNLSADYSGEVGSGVPERVWDGDVVRFDVAPDLTAAEINQLLQEIAPFAQEWIDVWDVDLGEFRKVGAQQETYLHVTYKIERLCEERRTESGGIWDAGDWASGSTHDDIGLDHDSTDADLDKIAEDLRGIAIDDGVTLENLDEYLIDQREILRADTQEV